MTHERTSTHRGWSLPITWIPVFIGLTLLLVYRYGWWWLGVPVVLYSAIAVISLGFRRKADAHKEGLLKVLQHPLYGLFHMESIEQSATGGYLYDIVPGFRENYDSRVQHEIMKAIELAISDPDIDFSQTLPGLPFNNADIKKHLAETLKRLKAQE
jgi:hypothetical protein